MRQTLLTKKIGVLMGGLSAERAVSVRTGESVAAALADRGYHVQPVFVDRDIDLVLRQSNIDVAFLALHGRYGEDGCVQGLLELLGIPYTGSDVLASALAMHKVKAKEIFRLHNLPTPAYYVAHPDDGDPLARHGDFGYPVVVKPVAEGSSVGVQVAATPDELIEAWDSARCFDDILLVERYVRGREVSVAVVGNRALGAVEVAPRSGFYDYGAKYSSHATDYFIPPRLSPARYRGVLTQALRAHRALGCSGATRVDMIVSDSGNEQVLEVNTIPGMTPNSLLPMIAASVGLDFGDLCEAVLHGARVSSVDRDFSARRARQQPLSGRGRGPADAPGHH